MTSGLLGFGAVSSGPVSSGPIIAGGGPNALRRLLQSQYAADARKREAEGEILALQAMIQPQVVETKAERLQSLEKLHIEAIIAEDDDDILPFIGP